MKSKKEAQGYSRKAYEHWVGMKSNVPRSLGADPAVQSNSTYLIILQGILSTPECVQKAANLPKPPTVINAASEDKGTLFCEIDGVDKQAITKWLYQNKFSFKPTFVHVSKATKDFAAYSIYPTFGLEATLPHYRPSSGLTMISPSQDEYPVWYFFYGTLADSNVLKSVLSLP